MLSGLYGDLPEAKKNSATSGNDGKGWSQKPKFAPPVRKPGLIGAPRAVLGSAKKPAREAEGSGSASSAGRPVAASGEGPSAVPAGLLGSAKEEVFQDEYDPARPNEYDAVRKDRERLRQEAQEEADRQEELRLLQERDREADENMRGASNATDRQAALAVSGEEAYMRRARLGRPGSRAPAETAAADAGSSFAQRMMEKMGWKEGLGLGKAHQGITTPLTAQKTDHRSGVIVNADPLQGPDAGGPPAEKRPRGVSIQGTPSRVVLLRNIVGPGEVDDTLEDEIGEECSKYGLISRIVIFEVTEPGYPPEQAVRIFVEFERMESAMKALIDLDGRFFGGRNVKAVFFSEQRLEKQELAPIPGQPD